MPPMLTDQQIEDGRTRILKVAERQAATSGIEHVSLHGIAKELGWTATALYRYFENKDAMLAAARSNAFNRLSDRLEASMQGPGDIWAKSRALGRAYVDFAFAEPDAYRLIFSMTQPDSALYPALRDAEARGHANMTRYLELMVEEGQLEADPVLLGHVFWAGLHGVVSLQMAGKLLPSGPSFEAIRRDLVSRVVRSALGPRVKLRKKLRTGSSRD